MEAVIGVLLIQGLGHSKVLDAIKIEAQLRKEVKRISPDLAPNIVFESVDYQTDMQIAQESVWHRMKTASLRWNPLRRFCLHYLSDATAYQHHPDIHKNSYVKTHQVIQDSMQRLQVKAGSRKMIPVVLAGSMGCMVMCNYLWDAQQGKYLWAAKKADHNPTEGLLNLELLITWGCNIPLFVSSLPEVHPIQVPPMAKAFRWFNYYDKDDVLGWPLKPLSPSYAERVTEDIPFNSGWTPMGHTKYWSKRSRMARQTAQRLLDLWQQHEQSASYPLAA
ncbi:MAG: hypothetical protein AAF399_02005 [Bacteroidota bacterium]